MGWMFLATLLLLLFLLFSNMSPGSALAGIAGIAAPGDSDTDITHGSSPTHDRPAPD